jgi:hypothetical protein
MKLLILPLVLAGAGAGWFGLRAGGAALDAGGDDCRVTVECTERGTCLVTCTDAAGAVRCQREVACDEPCERDCERSCGGAELPECQAPCPPGRSSAR